jgi:CRISPR-associated protein Cas2
VSMTVVVTRDVAPRIRGFLTSCMLEVAPGVYVSPRMTRAVRERVWDVVAGWFDCTSNGCLVMTWREKAWPGGIGLALLGTPPRELREHDGLFLVRRSLTPHQAQEMGGQQSPDPPSSRAADSSLKSE